MSLSPRMALALPALAALALAVPSRGDDKKVYPTMGKIERLDPRLDKLLAADARLEKLADGFDWAEGPVWVPDGKYLLFSDIPKNLIWKWQENQGLSRFLEHAGYTGTAKFTGKEPGSNGLTLDANGRLVLCEHGDRRVARLEKDGKKTTLADPSQGKRLNSPNDLVFKSNGDLYFTDPPYGLPKQMEDPDKVLDFQGVYRMKATGELTLLTKEMSRPNGIALSPDQKTLYVANSDPARAIWMAFPLGADGTISGPGRVIYDATSEVVAKKP